MGVLLRGSYRCFYRFVFECFYRCLLGVRELFFFGVSASIGAFVASESSSSLWWSVGASIGVFVVCEVVSESSACESFLECFYRDFRVLLSGFLRALLLSFFRFVECFYR